MIMVHAVVLYAGGLDLAKMTESMISQLWDSAPLTGMGLRLVMIRNGMDGRVLGPDAENEIGIVNETNVGCARAWNQGINVAEAAWGEPDYVLILNNDLEFPHKDWLEALLASASSVGVTVPGTDRTATKEAISKGPTEGIKQIESCSAYCWLVPQQVIRRFRKHYKFPLFDPDWTMAYGEDDWTSLLMMEQFGPKPFRLVCSSWVRHLKAQTAKELGDQLDRKATSRLLATKIRRLMAEGRCKGKHYLKRKCEWFLKVLKT